MSDAPLTDAELAAIERLHHCINILDAPGFVCCECSWGDMRHTWPCDAVRLLAEVRRLREALRKRTDA